jgi:PAS domain S-box-containing protein
LSALVNHIARTKKAEESLRKKRGIPEEAVRQRTKELRESRDWYRVLFNSLGDTVFVYRITEEGIPGTFIEVNDVACERLGYTREELLNMSPLDIIDSQGLESIPSLMEKLLAEKRVLLEITHVAKDGRKMPVELCVHLFNLRGTPTVLSMAREIPEHKGAEEGLLGRENEQRLSEIVRGSSIATFVIDKNHLITHWNKACEKLTGLSPSEVIGTKTQWLAFYPRERPVMADLIVDQLPEEEVARYYGRKYRESSVTDGAYEAEDFFPNLGERGKWLFFTAAPLKDVNGRIVGAIETLQDITVRKQAEEELSRHREHLEELVEERTAELQETNAELETFSYSVSHDLRAPLRAMHGFAQALLEDYSDRLNSVGKDYARRILEAAGRMEAMIHDLLVYSRLKRTQVQLCPVSLQGVVEETLRQLETEIRKHDAEIIVGKPLPEAMAHRANLIQVLANLVENAVKFVGPGVRPKVRISAKEDNGWVHLCVEDNGIGIALDQQERIFGVFERLHGVETYPGTGIGLAIVRKEITRMGGKIGVESTPGQGSRFWVELPKVKKTKDMTSSTILLVEDDPNDIVLIQRALRKANLANPVQVVKDGEEAVAYLSGLYPFSDRARHPYPMLVLLDLRLPRKSGLEVLTWLRRQQGMIRLPVVVVTGSRETWDINRARELGVSSYLLKPIVSDDFVKIAKTLNLRWLVLNEKPGVHNE